MNASCGDTHACADADGSNFEADAVDIKRPGSTSDLENTGSLGHVVRFTSIVLPFSPCVLCYSFAGKYLQGVHCHWSHTDCA